MAIAVCRECLNCSRGKAYRESDSVADLSPGHLAMVRWLRGHKFLLIAATLLLFLFHQAAIYLDSNRHLEWIGGYIGKVISGDFEVDGIDWGWKERDLWLRLEHVAIRGSARVPAEFSAVSLYLQVRIRPLLDKTLAVGRLLVTRPVVT